MESPEKDLIDRKPIWGTMQMVFMDKDVDYEIDNYIVVICAKSKYSIQELKEIFFNEVHPACIFNLFSGIAPEWAGFEIEWLSDRILKKNRFGKPISKWSLFFQWGIWKQIEKGIIEHRKIVETQHAASLREY